MSEQDPSDKQPFVFLDPESAKIFALACRVAAANIPVLITGPTGSGKEILAKVIHETSNNANGPFVPVNCAAIPTSLAENLLFGHEKGAFTNATSSTPGFFEQAHNGTLFLDEIGEMPIELQPKILRALQERKITRIGGTRQIDVNVRVVAATNVNLQEEIKNHRFREDLYYRLSAFKFNMPRLANRPLDIKPLACLMIQKYSTRAQLPELSECAIDKLLRHSWPGNIRELENVISRALILSDTDLMTADEMIFDCVDEIDQTACSPGASLMTESVNQHVRERALSSESALYESVQNVEFRSILSALRASRTRADAAKQLGISQRTLRHKLQMYRVDGHRVPDAYAR